MKFDLAFSKMYLVEGLKDKEKPLYQGMDFQIGAGYFLTKRLAAGLLVSRLSQSNSYSVTQQLPAPADAFRTTRVYENLNVDFLAAAGFLRAPIFDQLALGGDLAVGYLRYNDAGEVAGEKLEVAGGTLGFQCGAGIEVHVLPELAVGLEARHLFGSLSGVTVKNDSMETDVNRGINLGRYSLGGGVRLLF